MNICENYEHKWLRILNNIYGMFISFTFNKLTRVGPSPYQLSPLMSQVGFFALTYHIITGGDEWNFISANSYSIIPVL